LESKGVHLKKKTEDRSIMFASFATLTRQVALIGLILVSLCAVAHAEIKTISFLLKTDSESSFIQHYEGNILAPGVIDLSRLSFANSDLSGNETGVATSGTGTAIDVIAIPLPKHCDFRDTSSLGCPYTDLGVGGRTLDGTVRWCCSNEAIDLGLCSHESYGRLIVNQTTLAGEARYATIPLSGVSKPIDSGVLKLQVSGDYSVVLFNCNQESGRSVRVSGNIVWKSKHGYLPGDVVDVSRFNIFLVDVYLFVLSWHGMNMCRDKESRKPIQQLILYTILFGLLEQLFYTTFFVVWNADGSTHSEFLWATIVTGILKRVMFFCLAVLAALGWGMVHDSVAMCMLLILAKVYTAVSALLIPLYIYWFRNSEKYTMFFDFLVNLHLILNVINVVFYLYAVIATNRTLRYLRHLDVEDSEKVQRYRKLRMLYLCGPLVPAAFYVAAIPLRIEAFPPNWKEVTHYPDVLIYQPLRDVIFVCALLGIAILMRPLPIQECKPIDELPDSNGSTLTTALKDQDASTTTRRKVTHREQKPLLDDGGEAV
jgi:hypothetical protein